MTDIDPRVGVGQGAFELGEASSPSFDMAEVIETYEGERRMAASTVIKLISDSNPPDPSEITERDVRIMTPAFIRRGLFTEPFGSEVENAIKGVVMPASEFGVLARSPSDLAKQMDVRAQASHEKDLDKIAVDALGKRAAGHTLQRQHAKVATLVDSLTDQLEGVQSFLKELQTAGGSGFYAHFSRRGITMLRGMSERAIFDALHVSGGTLNWNAEQTERAIRTLRYQLYGQGKQVPRVKNWIGYTGMARDYLNARARIAAQVKHDVFVELQKYKPFLDAAKDAQSAADDVSEAS